MKRFTLALGVAGLAILAFAAVALAAGPGRGAVAGAAGGGTAISDVLGLSQAEIQQQRQEGLSLAQIAEAADVDAQRLVTAFTARWEERISARVEAGALTEAEATELRTQLVLRARDLVYSTATGGMQGAAVGAGPDAAPRANSAASGTGDQVGSGPRGNGTGTGVCDGSGPNGAGRP